MKKNRTLRLLTLLCLLVFITYSCIKRNFDHPPNKSGFDPDLTVTHTIAQLKQMSPYVPIEEDVVIEGIVTMNDQSGNYFRKMVVQDTSGGIELLVDASQLYLDYPLGRKVYIKCNGLYLGSYAENPQLGYTPDLSGLLTGIPALLTEDFIIKASFPHPIVTDTLSLADLKPVDSMQRYYNTLITLKDVEFDTQSIGRYYAEPATLASVTMHSVGNCIERNVRLKTSAYARFRMAAIPAGNGTVTGVYVRNYKEAQLYIRDTSDVRLNGLRCREMVTTLLFQDFSAMGDGALISLPGWNNFPEEGNKSFRKESDPSGISFARITAFGGSTPPVVRSWLITPLIDLSEKWHAQLSYKIRDGYDNGATIRVYVSTDYKGYGHPAEATWKQLQVPVSQGSTTGYAPDWTVVYTNLPSQQPVYIAFCYYGGTGKTTTFDITDIRVFSE